MRLNKSATLATIFAVMLALVGGVPASATAAAQAAVTGVSIDKLGTDAMGADTRSNAFREYIVVQNDTDKPVNVDGLVTRDEWSKAHTSSTCNTAEFSNATLPTLPTDKPGDETEAGLWLPVGETITVYSGGKKNGKVGGNHYMSLNRFGCGLHGHYLNNNNDTVYLMDGGTVVDEKGYNFHGGYVVS